MNDAYGEHVERGTIRFVRVLPGPIERVWAMLTDPALRARWLAGGAIELRVGGAVELHFRNAELSHGDDPAPAKYRAQENGGSMFGRITQLDPPRLLAYTWSATMDDADDAVSEVTFALAPVDTGVRLTLTHRRLPDDAMPSVAGGWHTHLGILDDVLSDRPARPFWRMHTRIEAEYEARLAQA